MLEERIDDYLILDRFQKIKLLQKTAKFRKYLLKDVYTGQRIQIKAQSNRELKPTVLHEAGFLQELQGYPGFPLMIWSGNYMENQNALFTERLGSNLSELMNAQEQSVFSLATVCQIGIQIVKIFEIMHQKNTVMDQIVPENFRLSATKVDQIVVGSMLHSKRYRSAKNLQLYKQKKLEKLDFFNPFLCHNKLSLRSACRRDDLQSLFYMLVYMKKGSLPWSKLFTKNKSEFQAKVLEMHKNLVFDRSNAIFAKLLQGLPQQFLQIFEHIYHLSFQERPNYCLVRRKLQKVISKISKKSEPILDWIKTQSSKELKLTKSQDLKFTTTRYLEAQRKYFLPFSRKVLIDYLAGTDEEQGMIERVDEQRQVAKKQKDKCQIM